MNRVSSKQDSESITDWKTRLLQWLRRWRQYGYTDMGRAVRAGALVMAITGNACAAASHARPAPAALIDAAASSSRQAGEAAQGYFAAQSAVLSY